MLVAGGLGERLGSQDIKISLPFETLTYKKFLEFYCENIQQMEILSKVEGLKIPLIIMTSKDTHQKTSELLEKNDNFGIQIEVI